MSKELIRNCKFRYKCDQKWEELIDTDQYGIKFCKVCQENVHLCGHEDTLIAALKNNWCVAMYAEYDEEIPTLLGDVESGYFIKK